MGANKPKTTLAIMASVLQWEKEHSNKRNDLCSNYSVKSHEWRMQCSLWFSSTPLFDLNFANVFRRSTLSLLKCPLIKNQDLQNAKNDAFPQDSARN